MTAEAFQRARRPEQVGVRRAAILAAAAALFDEAGPEGAGLNAIAARAGFTKSNVYRYFESREAVLVELFVEEFEGFLDALEDDLAAVAPGDAAAVARRVAGAFIDRPRLGRLLAMLSGVLERNISEAAVIALKTRMLGYSRRIAEALARALPAFSLEDCAWLGAIIGTYVSGIWPTAHPNPIVAAVLARPEFCPLRPSMSRDLERLVLVLLKGLGAD